MLTEDMLPCISACSPCKSPNLLHVQVLKVYVRCYHQQNRIGASIIFNRARVFLHLTDFQYHAWMMDDCDGDSGQEDEQRAG